MKHMKCMKYIPVLLAVMLLQAVLLLLVACGTAPGKRGTSDVSGISAVTDGAATPDVSTVRDPDGVIIALIDTGISTVAIDEEDILPGHNYVLDSDDTEDRINHGTAVASIIAGCESAEVECLAPDAFLVPLVVTDKVDGEIKSVTPDVLAQVIYDSIDIYGADLINVSLGIQKDAEELREAVAYAAEKDVPVISAVGNGGADGEPYYPAAYDTVLAVGSCDKNGERSDFSQDGADVLASGEDIMLASRNGVRYGIRGTSFATGFISAQAANLLREDPNMTAAELYEKIVE